MQLRNYPQHCVTTTIPEDEWIDCRCMATSVVMPTQVLKLVSRGAQNGHSDLKLYHQLLAFGLCVTIRAAHHIISCCGKFLVFISQPQVKKAKPSRMVKHNVIVKTLSYQLLQAKVPFSKGGSPSDALLKAQPKHYSHVLKAKKYIKRKICFTRPWKSNVSLSTFIFSHVL